MRISLLMLSILFLLLITVSSGCSKQRQSVWLGERLQNADTVILWDRARMDNMTITGNEVPRIVRAVSVAIRSKGRFRAQFDRTMEFYDGTNLLATIWTQQAIFKAADGDYADKSGTLRALNERFPDEAARKNGVNKLVSDFLTNSILRGLPSWSENLVRDYSSKTNTKIFHGDELDRGAVPTWIRTAWPREPDIYILKGRNAGVDCVVFEWLGSCGLAVGPTNFVAASNWNLKYVTNVTPGVYVYHQ
jgi:hypothetical protein